MAAAAAERIIGTGNLVRIARLVQVKRSSKGGRGGINNWYGKTYIPTPSAHGNAAPSRANDVPVHIMQSQPQIPEFKPSFDIFSQLTRRSLIPITHTLLYPHPT